MSFNKELQDPRATAEEAPRHSRLPDSTRAFVQRAFADSVVERIDERKKTATLKEKARWERNKWLLVRYVVDDQLTLEGLKNYAGVTSHAQAWRIYKQTLIILWEASPEEVKQQFPK